MLLVAIPALASAVGEETDARKAYLAKRAAEKTAAEQAVKELTVRDYATLSADDFIRFSYATSLEKIQAGLDRFEKFVKELA